MLCSVDEKRRVFPSEVEEVTLMPAATEVPLDVTFSGVVADVATSEAVPNPGVGKKGHFELITKQGVQSLRSRPGVHSIPI